MSALLRLALDFAADELKSSEDLLKAARVNVSSALGLRVTLLSGRHTTLILPKHLATMSFTLRKVARALDLNQENVLKHGALFSGLNRTMLPAIRILSRT